MTAQEWYEQGNAFRKESKWHEAINCYIQAIALDPDKIAIIIVLLQKYYYICPR